MKLSSPIRITQSKKVVARVGFLLLMLTAVGLILFTPYLGLIGDDWWFFSQLDDGNLPAAQLQENPARPGVAYLWMLFWSLFGLQLWAYYLLIGLLQWLSAMLVFLMLWHIFRLGVAPSAIAAALLLLYPADTAHVYLSTITTRVATLLALSGAYLWLYTMTRSTESKALLAASLLLMLLSLLTYETFVLLFLALPPALHFARPPSQRSWIFRWLPIYLVVLGYLAFRVGMVIIIANTRDTYYAGLRLEPDWLWIQMRDAFSATVYKGWLFALKSMLEWSHFGSLVVFIVALPLAIIAIRRLERADSKFSINRRRALALIGIGVGLSLAASAPAIVSNFELLNSVGTLDGRLLHGAGLGHGLVIVGSVALVSSVMPGESRQTALRNTLFGALIAIALVGGIGLQMMYARAWSAQLGILREIRTQAPALRDGSVVAILNVPSGPFDTRFYYPLTEMLRRYYGNPTLHVLPYQSGFPPNEQSVVFGEKQAYGVVELVRGEHMEFSYEQMLGFELGPNGEIRPVSEIGARFLCDESCSGNPLVEGTGWSPTIEPVQIGDVERFELEMEPPSSAWRTLLARSADFNSQFPLP